MKITVETKVAAPVETVWEAYTTPEDIKQWNAASNDWHTTSASVDLREGGTFSSRMEAKDGSAGFDFGHRSLAFDVACEVVEDRLPSVTLLLSRVRGVAVEGYPDADTGRVRRKHDLRRAVAERILDQLVLDDLCIGACEIETHASILRLHA